MVHKQAVCTDMRSRIGETERNGAQKEEVAGEASPGMEAGKTEQAAAIGRVLGARSAGNRRGSS